LETAARPLELARLRAYGVVTDLAKELSASDKNIVRLGVGINNDVYRVDTERRSFVLKCYPEVGPNRRDRMKAEVEFLQ
jgi:Ser/Thr protein kinase RdoA (MazF antagonist)